MMLCQLIIRFGIPKCLDDSGLWSEGEIICGVSFVRECMRKFMKSSDRIFHPSQDTKYVGSVLTTRFVRFNACANLIGSLYCRHWVCVTKNTRGNYLCIVKR
jgi:hypothetical protein